MEILTKKPDLKHAFDVLDLYASDPDKRRDLEERIRADKNFAYELAARYELGLEKGLEQGLEKGELKKAMDSARKMRECGDSLAKIIAVTGLTESHLKEIGIV